MLWEVHRRAVGTQLDAGSTEQEHSLGQVGRTPTVSDLICGHLHGVLWSPDCWETEMARKGHTLASYLLMAFYKKMIFYQFFNSSKIKEEPVLDG